jgi:membrane-associated phospholipid phosphatase
VTLPVVWRPHTTRAVAYALAGTIMIGMIVLAVVVPPNWGAADRIGLVVFGLVIAWIMHVLARCRVVADVRGLTVVNPLYTRRYEWAEVIRVNMATGDPWPTLDLASGDSISAMGINGAEHQLAARQMTELRVLLHTYGEAPDPQP